MHPSKRLEIITDEVHVEEVGKLLRECGVEGFTVFPELHGWGDRGTRRGDEVSGSSANACILTACTPEIAGVVVEKMRPVLKTRGGICIISDAMVLGCSEAVY